MSTSPWVSRRTLIAAPIVLLLLALPLLSRADGATGDFSNIDFAASNPSSYDHSSGGGAFNDGGTASVVEQLNGGDFVCGDIVTFLALIEVSNSPVDANQQVDLNVAFDASSTSNGEVGFDDIVAVSLNDASQDSAVVGDATIALTSETPPPSPFTGQVLGTISVGDLEAGERIVVRMDVRLACGAGGATGTIQGELDGAINVVSTGGGNIPGAGNQTIPLQSVGEVAPEPGLSIWKELTGNADEDGSGTVTVGDTLSYEIVATNTGDAPLTGVTVSDPLIPQLNCTPALPASLAVDASVVCTGTYVVQPGDIPAGAVTNTATADSDQTSPVQDSTRTPVEVRVDLTVDKQLVGTTDVDNSGSVTPGDTLSYQIVATNTGDIELTGVTVSDSLIDTLACSPSPPAILAPGGAVVCIGSYVVTAADATAGSVLNVATADSEETPPSEDRVTTAIVPAPTVTTSATPTPTTTTPNARLRMTKTGPRRMRAGGRAVYRIVVRNVSKTTATNVVIRDLLPRGIVLRSRPPRSRIRGRIIRWATIPRIAPGARVVRRVPVRILRQTSGARCNTVVTTAANAARTRARTCARVSPLRTRVIPAVTG